MTKWRPEWNALADYNADKARASGAQYRFNDTPEERVAYQRAAQARLNAMSQGQLTSIEILQAEFDEANRGPRLGPSGITIYGPGAKR